LFFDFGLAGHEYESGAARRRRQIELAAQKLHFLACATSDFVDQSVVRFIIK
jgi:hypothetical protein